MTCQKHLPLSQTLSSQMPPVADLQQIAQTAQTLENVPPALQAVAMQIVRNLTPDLLKKGFAYDPQNPTKNFCYLASEAFYHSGGKAAGFEPAHARDDQGIVHWWLVNQAGHRIDLTKNQYLSQGRQPPYQQGVRGGFLTVFPNQRCQKLLQTLTSKGSAK